MRGTWGLMQMSRASPETFPQLPQLAWSFYSYSQLLVVSGPNRDICNESPVSPAFELGGDVHPPELQSPVMWMPNLYSAAEVVDTQDKTGSCSPTGCLLPHFNGRTHLWTYTCLFSSRGWTCSTRAAATSSLHHESSNIDATLISCESYTCRTHAMLIKHTTAEACPKPPDVDNGAQRR